MADLRAQAVYDILSRNFAVSGAGPKRFTTDFVAAVNQCINELNLDKNLQSPVELISGQESTLTNLDSKYLLDVVYGASHHLILMGRRPADGADELAGRYENLWELAKDRIYRELKDEDAENIDDTDIIGLGAIS